MANNIKTDAQVWFDKGMTLFKQGLYQEAIEAFEQSIRINPDYALAYCVLGTAYGNLNRYLEEVEAYKQAINIDPNYAEAYYNLGVAYGNYGNLNCSQEAVEVLKQSINLDFVHLM